MLLFRKSFVNTIGGYIISVAVRMPYFIMSQDKDTLHAPAMFTKCEGLTVTFRCKSNYPGA